ncbi:amidohydrolase family protein [Clostridium tetani]|uniref:Amidohydrolase n=1 Tax=Clostridium tetani TaxID=1513 RepID=A0ABC8EAH0_CLOTA|nr:amidohydrolase family protein [Clostridium tetani]RXI46421.1 amidohydrolase family protein [Clostridium tetani]RXM61654.1 amidohydrolase family protein [Clostridium tetani]RXM67727.1 amidohydrolase family protein [Clostridium tetani]BDR80515.1 amidohydrolase [Clostridium tetani]BDR88970.1 amidohydrolase [Clostridium tetani]
MSKIAFIGGLLIDGTGKEPIKNSLLLVDNKKIKYAGSMMDVNEEYEKIDITGKIIMPGLIDTHLHFSGNRTDNDTEWVLDPVIQKTIVAVAQAREALEHGLTSVGEISRSGIYIRNMIEEGVIPGPRVVTTGLGFCRTAGHGDSHKLPLDYNNDSHPWAERVDGPWDLRKAIRRRIRENPDAIKIWSTGGGIWRLDAKDDLHYCMEEIQAVVDECNMVGLPVWSHAEGYEGALNSCKAGVSAIIHGQELNEECLEIMKKKDITFCPTLQFFYEWFTVYEPPYRAIHDKYPGKNTAEKELNRIIDNLQNANKKGIRITVGSDSFCSSLTPYGEYAITEMYTLNKAGLTKMETILAATKNGAEMLRIDDITGTLEEGKFADLLVLSKNPLEDIHNVNTDNMEIIMKEGAFIKKVNDK